jgi:uncharacterized protein YjbI with pentapeptide repeats
VKYKCSHLRCQYQSFLPNEKIYFFQDETNCDCYCIFHAPKQIKDHFRISQRALFGKILFEYISYSKERGKQINFKKTVFINESFSRNDTEKGLDLFGYDLDFTDAVFLNNIRFDNIKCNKLILKDVYFLDGGAIKNRKGDGQLDIKELIFRPYEVASDFVIDIGQYAKRENSLIQDETGRIKKIEFENHKRGDGFLFFIGINKYTEKAHFQNMLLDKVYFQNCDLSNCYFLNAKIENTEFRNCDFPTNENLKYTYEASYQYFRWEYALIPMFAIVFSLMHGDFDEVLNIDNVFSSIYLLYIGLVVFALFISLATVDVYVELALYYLSRVVDKLDHWLGKYKENAMSNRMFHKHYCIADEKDIYRRIKGNDKRQREAILRTLSSLSSTYSQLKNNFQTKHFQKAGDFFYTQRYTEMLVIKRYSASEQMVFSIHHFTNGFGECFMKPFVWFFMTILIFAFVFTFSLKPNESYGTTADTPLYLIVDSNLSHTPLTINANSSFIEILNIKNSSSKKKYTGFNKKGDYNISTQSILKLHEGIGTGLIKSLSNMLYPISLGTKKWFKNFTQAAVVFSLLETILLWYFAGAFILALWHRIKR